MKASGFTLIELVSVIVIVAILSAIALPSVVDLKGEAERASLRQHSSSFRTSLLFARVSWQLSGQPGLVDNLTGFGDGTVDFNSLGYPIDGTSQGNSGGATNNNIPNNNNGDLRCRRLFQSLLIGPDSVCGGTGAQGVACDDQMFRAARSGANVCRYSLLDEPARYFEYRVLSGDVTLIDP
jgi:prepilin-type N-terminal cleavage/methylation domain-containing protein